MADEYPDRPGYSFGDGEPEDVRRFFANKSLRPAFSWLDVEPEEHAVAFTVAKATQLDVLTTIQGALQRSLDEGVPFDQFQRELKPELQRLGWWGRSEATDPSTGEVVLTQLGSPRRLKTIFEANVRTARAAGQWERIQRTKRAMPFLEYRLGPSERHRPLHALKAGTVLPVDSPFWAEWTPPNGWGCKCWLKQITRRAAEDLGIGPEPEVPTRTVTNPRTGERREVPLGIDPGWQSNPGRLRAAAAETLLADRMAGAPEPARKAAIRDIARSWRATRLSAGPVPHDTTLALLPAELPGQAAARAGHAVLFSDRSRAHLFEEHDDRRVTDLAYLADLDRADRIAWQERKGAHPRLVFEIDGAAAGIEDARYEALPLRFVLTVRPSSIFVNTFFRAPTRRWEQLVGQSGTTVLRE